MTVYTCNICKVQYSHDKAYRHFLDCSWNQVKAKRKHDKPVYSNNNAEYSGMLLNSITGQPTVQRS